MFRCFLFVVIHDSNTACITNLRCWRFENESERWSCVAWWWTFSSGTLWSLWSLRSLRSLRSLWSLSFYWPCSFSSSYFNVVCFVCFVPEGAHRHPAGAIASLHAKHWDGTPIGARLSLRLHVLTLILFWWWNCIPRPISLFTSFVNTNSKQTERIKNREF